MLDKIAISRLTYSSRKQTNLLNSFISKWLSRRGTGCPQPRRHQAMSARYANAKMVRTGFNVKGVDNGPIAPAWATQWKSSIFWANRKNVLFVCDECLADGTAHALDTVNSLSLEIVNLKNSVDEIKEAVCNGSQEKVTQELQELKSVVQEVKQTSAVTSEAKLHFPIPKSKTENNFELRFSGISEFNSSTKSGVGGNRSKERDQKSELVLRSTIPNF